MDATIYICNKYSLRARRDTGNVRGALLRLRYEFPFSASEERRALKISGGDAKSCASFMGAA